MSILDWREAYSVGIDEFDGHHKQLIEQLNTAFDALVGGAAAGEVEQVLDDLIDAATRHFACEQAWMVAHGSPVSAGHDREREQFDRCISEIRKDHPVGARPVLETLTFLKAWLTNHVVCADPCGRFAGGGLAPVESGPCEPKVR